MKQNKRELFDQAVQSWINASRFLHIKITAPFSVSMSGKPIDCIAFLPDFGSQKGMLVGIMFQSDFEADWELENYAKQHKMFCSFLSVPDYANYDRDKYIEALSDWGYFGPSKRRPSWLAK